MEIDPIVEDEKKELNDEELALQLQQQFDDEMNTPNKDFTPTEQSQLEMDKMFALSFQEEINIQEEEEKKKKAASWSNYPKTVPAFGKAKQAKQPVGGKLLPTPNLRQQPQVPPTSECVQRIIADLKEVMIQGGYSFIYAVPDEEDITHIQALIVGPEETPYANDMQFPTDYPWQPPHVTIMTTAGGTCRFNPNLYSNGKVCLSILGTWSGPGWTQIQTMLSTLLSVQSLMCSTPYKNEPGYENERNPGDIKNYNDCIRHETLRVAVVGMMTYPTCNELFKEEMKEHFLKKYDSYVEEATNHLDQDGVAMVDPFGEDRGVFNYERIITELVKIKQNLEAENDKMEIDEKILEQNEPLELEPKEEKITNFNEINSTPNCNNSNNNNQILNSNQNNEEDDSIIPEDEMDALFEEEMGDVDSPIIDVNNQILESEKRIALEDEAREQAKIEIQELTQEQQIQQLAKSIELSVQSSNNNHDVNMVDDSNQIVDNKEKTQEDLDMELALKLQQEFELEANPEKEPHYNDDLEFAKKIQQEMYKSEMEKGKPPPPAPVSDYGASPYPPYSYYNSGKYGSPALQKPRAPGDPTSTVKPPTLAELRAAAQQESEDTNQIRCLICHQIPDQYIVLPACEQPHTYCMQCAKKMTTNVPKTDYNRYSYKRPKDPKTTNGKLSLKCILCSSVSNIHGGVESLRIKKKKIVVEGQENICQVHQQEFCLFCFDCNELICAMCTGSEHNRHACEAMNVSQHKVIAQINSGLGALKKKKTDQTNFVQTALDKKKNIDSGKDTTLKDFRNKITRLKELLDKKEKEIEESINQSAEVKVQKIESEIKRANEKIDKLDEAILASNDLLDNGSEDPLKFLLKTESTEETIRMAKLIPEPETKNEWFTLTPVKTSMFEQYLHDWKYRDRKNNVYGGYDEYDMSDSYSDEDDYY